jgi:hypothetical protein
MKGRSEGWSELPPTHCNHTSLERGHSGPPAPCQDAATDRSTRTPHSRPCAAPGSRLLPLFVLGLIATLAAGSSTAYGQLTAADIAALRARGREEGWTFQVGESSATHRPLSQLCGAVEPSDWREKGRFDPGPKHLGPLPAAFDWRTQGASVPIRDQLVCGSKGSCWAFATVGPLEYAIQFKDGLGVDLSEQYLLSCNTTANPHWDCDWGGWAAHDWHMNTAGSCTHTGAVLEAYYPYIHDDLACTCTKPTNHVYRIRSWAYLGGRQDTNPPVDVLKQAILDHGPITVCVVAGPLGSPFHAYQGGIFNACSGSSSDHDHMVVLVGWDDNQAGGVWFARNSWGTDWGENGYMRIKYNCSNIGYAACYIDYAGADALQVSPSYGLTAEGLMGGPFDPATVTYTLSNQSAGNVAWAATWTQPWLEISPNHGGMLAPFSSIQVTVTINSNANTLGPGLHTDAVMFNHIFGAPDHTNIMPVSLTVQRQTIYNLPPDTDPRWSLEGEWEFGRPTGQGGSSYGFSDPSGGFTGTNVFGVNLNGDYAVTNVPSPWYYLRTKALDFRGHTRTALQFQRWLNCRFGLLGANVTIDVSTNNTDWTTIWSNTGLFSSAIRDAYWTQFQCSFPAWADNYRYVYVRWGYKVPDATPCSSWNIDDIQFQGIHVPIITNQPASRTNSPGTTATFAVTAGGLGPLSYHWVKYGTNYLADGGDISGAATATLTISNVLGADRGNYSVVITNVADGTVTSSTATLTVNDPLVTSQPTSRTNTAGTTATFTVSAAGTTPLGYQWVKNAIQYLTDTNNISGARTNTLTLTNVAPSDAGTYTVVVTNPAGSVTSAPAILTVLVPPAIVAQPQSQTNYFGTTAAFIFGVTGTQPLSYQWRKDTADLPGRTNASLILTNLARRDTGFYAVFVTNICGSVLSSNAVLLVRVPQRLGTPVLLSDGTCVILSADADGGLLSTNDLANFEVYASTNLDAWLRLTNPLTLTDGQLQLCDPESTNLPQRFYRFLER